MEFKKNEVGELDSAEITTDEAVKAPKKRKGVSGPVRLILVISIIAFLCSSAIIVINYEKRRKNIEMNTSLEAVFKYDGSEELPFNFDEMTGINPAFVGWINVPNTSISLPVVQGSDNSYYLNHSFYREYDRRGTVFMDYRNNPTDFDANTILYGHNCYDGTMFSELEKYQEMDFYKSSPVIEYYTKNGKTQWKVYAVFITNAKAEEDNGYIFNYIYPYMDGENFDGFINEVNKRRLYDTGIDITEGDNMLILSTCIRKLDVYKNGKRTYKADTRLVVLARMVRTGESAKVDTSAVVLNPSPKFPQLWYDKNGIKNPYINDEKWYPQEAV